MSFSSILYFIWSLRFDEIHVHLYLLQSREKKSIYDFTTWPVGNWAFDCADWVTQWYAFFVVVVAANINRNFEYVWVRENKKKKTILDTNYTITHVSNAHRRIFVIYCWRHKDIAAHIIFNSSISIFCCCLNSIWWRNLFVALLRIWNFWLFALFCSCVLNSLEWLESVINGNQETKKNTHNKQNDVSITHITHTRAITSWHWINLLDGIRYVCTWWRRCRITSSFDEPSLGQH